MEVNIITILVGLSCGLAGFGLSELLLVVGIKERVGKAETEIETIKSDKTETVKLLTAVVNQNTKLLAHLGVDE